MYKLKTGVQWHLLPLEKFFKKKKISYQTVFYHYNSWCKSGFFEKIYAALIVKHKKFIKLKIMNMDGTHTPAKKGGEEVAYQGRKQCKTTNLLIISDSNGCPLVCSHAISGNDNDLFNNKEHASKMLTKPSGLFTNLNNTLLNADSGFDADVLREVCRKNGITPNFDINKRNTKNEKKKVNTLDYQVYKERFSIERLNVWVEGYKTFAVRHETSAINWVQLHYLVFFLIFLKKTFQV